MMAGKVIGRKGTDYELISFMGKQRRFRLPRKFITANYDQALGRFRRRFPDADIDVEDFLDLVKYLRHHEFKQVKTNTQ